MINRLEAGDVLRSVIRPGDKDLKIGHLLDCLFKQFGGMEGFAGEVKRDFDGCDVGHSNRVRIESDMMRTLANYTGDDDEQMDDIETLEALLVQLQAKRKMPGGNEK